MNELIISLVSGTIGGIIVLLFQKLWDNREKNAETKKNLLIDPTKNKKILPTDILHHLETGLSIEKAREFLGIPDNVYTHHEPEESENSVRPQIYLYNFHNAALKLSSTDKLSIDSITVFTSGNEKLKIEIFPNRNDETGKGLLGDSKINDEIIDSAVKHYDLSSMRERIFAIEAYFGRFGNYLNYTYFGTDHLNYEQYLETNDIQLLKGEKIHGFCVSNTDFAPLISIYEMR